MESTKQVDYSIGTPTDLRTGTLSDVGLSSWKRGEVIPRIFDWARNEEGNIMPSRARRAFLIVNNDELDVQSGYSFPVAVPNSDGVLIVTREGVNAANSRLGALINNPENTDIPLDVLQRARVRLENYREEFQEIDKGMSITDTPTSTKDLAEAVSIGDYREEGTPEKNCVNCFHNTDGFCDRFDFVHGGADFVSDAWLPVNTEATHHEEDETEDKTESKRQGKLSLIKNIVLDWVDSVFSGNKQIDLVENEEEKTIITPDVDDIPTQSTMKIFKNKSGRYVFIGRYSNNFLDNDIVQEIITRKAHIDYIARVNNGEVPLPELWIMHNPEWKVGQVTHLRWDENEKGQGFAMTFGLFDEDKHYIAESLASSAKSLAMSHGYGEHPVVYDSFNSNHIVEYTDHEQTIAPPDLAANKLTSFNIQGNEKMAIENKREIEDVLGLGEGHLDTLEGQNGKALEIVGNQLPSKTIEQSQQTEEESEIKQEKTESPINGEIMQALSLTLDKVQELTAKVSELNDTVTRQAKTIEAIKQPIDSQVAKVASEISPESLSALVAKAHGLNGSMSVVGREDAYVKGSTRYGKDEPSQPEQPEAVKPNSAKAKYGQDDRFGLGGEFSN